MKPIPSLSLAAIPTERVFHKLFNDMYILNIYLQEIFVRVVGMKNGDKIVKNQTSSLVLLEKNTYLYALYPRNKMVKTAKILQISNPEN